MKQLVAYIDLLGFSYFYEAIKLQKKADSERFAFLAVNELYQSYIGRLKTSIAKAIKDIQDKIGQGMDFDSDFLQSISTPHILAISDSIIIAIDCTEKNVVATYMILANALLMLTEETMKSDYMQDYLKKYNLAIFCPVRGGIAFDYSKVNLTGSSPYLYGPAFYRAYRLEKKATWPRIAIDPDLNRVLSQNNLTQNSLDDGAEFGEIPFFDIMKFLYTQIIQNVSESGTRNDIIEDVAKRFKAYIELNAQHASFLSILPTHTHKDTVRLREIYSEWIYYYNKRINWLIQHTTPRSETAESLLITDTFLDETIPIK